MRIIRGRLLEVEWGIIEWGGMGVNIKHMGGDNNIKLCTGRRFEFL